MGRYQYRPFHVKHIVEEAVVTLVLVVTLSQIRTRRSLDQSSLTMTSNTLIMGLIQTEKQLWKNFDGPKGVRPYTEIYFAKDNPNRATRGEILDATGVPSNEPGDWWFHV